MSEQGTRIPLPILLRQRLQAFRSADDPDSDVCLKDPRSEQTHWLKPDQFFVLDALREAQTYEALEAAFLERFQRAMNRQEVDALLANVANLELFTRPAQSHPLVAPFAQQTSEVAPEAEPNKAPPTPGSPPSTPELPDIAPNRGGVHDVLGLDETIKRLSFRLFDPSRLLRRLQPIVFPLRHVVYAVPVLVLAATGVTVRYADQIEQDLTRLLGGMSLVEHLLLGLVTVNLAVTLSTALVAQRFRASVRSIDLVLALGFVPRLVATIGHVQQLQKRELVWLHAAPLLTRLTLFSLAVLTWYSQRGANGTLASFALSLAVVCFASFLFSANPLAKGSGYQLLATLIEEPNLRGRSVQAFFAMVRGNRHNAAGNEGLAAYALASVVFMLLAMGFVVSVVASWLQFQLGAGGVVVALGLGGFLIARTASRFRLIAQSLDRAEQLDRWRNRTLHKRDEPESGERGATADKSEPGPRRFAPRAALLCAVFVLFLPYPFEPSGQFVIIPAQKQPITSDVSGTIEHVYFDGGETLKEGTVVARLASHDHRAEMLTASERMAEQQAVVDELLARPRPEEVEVGRKAVLVARIRAEFSKADHKRLKTLFDRTAASLEDVEAARRQYEVDLARIDEAKAELALVEAGAPPDEIRAAKAKYERWRVERDAHQGRIDRSSVRLPFDGQLVTLHLKQRIGLFLEPGEPFADAENSREVLARIEVPESDVPYITEEAGVEIRTWAHYDQPIVGEVVDIEANVVEESFGNVVTVISRFDNSQGRLKAGMTGYAKIEGERQPVWKVFSRALVRFGYVEAWSWIP